MTYAPVKVFAPASLSNLGPGFDTVGLAFEGPGDTIIARLTRSPGIVIESAVRLPTEPELNTAGCAALVVLQQAKSDHGLHLTIQKGIPLGSGVGGSGGRGGPRGGGGQNEEGGPGWKKTEVGGGLG
ncbi:MAG: hypothetical protein OXM02_08345, partial [Bacteroidota bacterium]|nr:hypothetical protein [Bacteroidota bacterium]